jgi:hypothetical protein
MLSSLFFRALARKMEDSLIAYVETSVISFYYETRAEVEMAARKKWTRSWWNSAVRRHDLVTSAAVVEELREWGFPQPQRMSRTSSATFGR